MRPATTTTLALVAALAGLSLLAPAAVVDAKGLRMTLAATGEQLLHAVQEAAGIDPEADAVVCTYFCPLLALSVCCVGGCARGKGSDRWEREADADEHGAKEQGVVSYSSDMLLIFWRVCESMERQARRSWASR